MCLYSEVLGSGDILSWQILAFLTMMGTTLLWIFIFVKSGLKEQLIYYGLPIALFVVFGTLDLLITTKGTFFNPFWEGNPLLRFMLVNFGHFGLLLGTFGWISGWAGFVFVINKLKVRKADFFSLTVFYSLFVGHFVCFGSWFEPMCYIRYNFDMFFSEVHFLVKVILVGAVLAIAHSQMLHNFIKTKKHPL
jgi:hypothetical protein